MKLQNKKIMRTPIEIAYRWFVYKTSYMQFSKFYRRDK